MINKMATTFRLGFVFLLLAICLCEKRKLKTNFLHPDDPKLCLPTKDSIQNLVHSTATGSQNVIHWIFSTFGQPSVLVAQTPLHTDLVINWKKLCSNESKDMADSVSFSKLPTYSNAVIFTKLFEYNDTEDDANMDAENTPGTWVVHDFNKFTWTNSSQESDDKNIIFKVDLNSTDLELQNNGSIIIKFQVQGIENRNEEMPGLALNENSTMVDFILDNLAPQFPKSRFAVELVLITSDPPEAKNADISSKRYIDDEHTPGNFKIVDWTINGTFQTSGAYIQWKPVTYTDPERNIDSLNKAKDYDLIHVNASSIYDSQLDNNIAYAFYGDSMALGHIPITASNISFGESGDKFYINSNYSAWTFAIGFGDPLEDDMSPLIIIIISVGLGLPGALIIFGGVGVIIKRKRDAETFSAYSSIQ